MEILASIVSKIAEYTVAPIGRHVGYLFSYNHNFKELNDQVEKLKIAREDIESLVELEKGEGNEILLAVKNWLERVDGVTAEARQLCEDPRRETVGCTECPFANLWRRHQLSRKAKKLVKNVANVQEDGKFKRDEIGRRPAIDGVGSPSATSHFVNFESRRSLMNEILLALADPKLSILGVHGFGGVGKSTLVKQIAGKALFKEVAMVSVTRIPDLRRIQGEIADQLGLQFREETVPGRAYRLRKRITQVKNILIILDDIWATIELEDIGIPYGGNVNFEERKLPSLDDQKGCKVLLISRNQDVLQQMGTQKEFGLDVLSDKETWTLFEVMAGKNTEDRTYEGIAGEVARICAGLPVLILPVARALRNRDKHAWKDNLKKLAGVNNKELHDIINSSLEWSYNLLENDEVKAVFLLCGVEGPCVSVQYLLKCAVGLGIFKEINTVEDASSRLYNIISALKASSLLHEDEFNVGFVKMHDVVHGVATAIASRGGRAFVRNELTEWPTGPVFLKSCSKIILKNCNIQKLPGRLDCPELEFFLLDMTKNYSLEIPNSFFEGMKKLKVLDLTGMNISSLPASLYSLTKLETLCLDQCTIGDIAGIGALKNLKILSLLHSSMAELPREIRQLSNMRMLDISNSKIAVIPPNIISSLITLEALYMGGVSIEWEYGNLTDQGKNASLAELRQLPNLSALEVQIGEARNLPRDLSLDKLERFKILIGGEWKWTDTYETSNILKLKLSTSIHLEHGIRALTKKVESLWLDEINGISNVLYQLNGEGFPLLKHLHIQNNTQIQHIINSMGWNQAYDSFPILETLELQNLSKLEKLSYGLLSVNSLSKLKVIKVKSCQQLKYLFSDSMVKRLSQLNEIEVFECNSLQEIVFVENGSVGDNGITDTIEFRGLRSLTLQKLPKIDGFFSNESAKGNEKRLATTSISDPFFKAKVAFPNLEALKLSSINFHRIWDDDQHFAICAVQNLTSLVVEDCGNLKYLFSFSMIPSLVKLKQLEISKCHMMEEIIDPEEGRNNAVALKEVQFPSLEKIKINDMENLRTGWHYQSDGLKSIVIEKCAKLVCIFPSHMQRKFHNLETLTVRNCDSVKEIFELDSNEIDWEADVTKLANLTLSHLPKLKQIWNVDPDRIVSFPDLQAVRVLVCGNLEYLFPLSIATRIQKIEKLEVIGCDNMMEIVAKKGQTEPTVRFLLNQLTTLRLQVLNQLRGFYAGNYTLSCPSLKNIAIYECENLVLLKTEYL